jgi:Tol biopolymer transport system component
MKLACILTALALSAAPAQSPDVQLRAAQQKEMVEGDLPGAIAMYRKIADDRSAPAEIAARALIRLGRCYQRMGSTEARKAFERVLNQFGAQTSAVAEAKQLLAAMPHSGVPSGNRGLVVRRLQAATFANGTETLTRDGEFGAAVRGRSEIDLVNVTTGERTAVRTQQPITAGNESIYMAVISPDGQHIVVDVPKGINASELRLIDRATGQVKTLFHSDSAFRMFAMDWSRDGRTILAREGGEGGGLLLIDIESGAVRTVSQPGAYEVVGRLSPDGQLIAHEVLPQARSKDVPKIFVERIDGSEDQIIADPEGGARLAGWSADGRFVLYTSNDLGVENLWAIRVENGRPKGEAVNLAKGIPRGTVLTMTERGSLTVNIVGPVRFYIAAIDPATGVANSPKDVNLRVNAQIVSAIWPRDGDRLVYSVLRDRASEKPVDLYLRDERTGEERKLGSFPMMGRMPSWTPDGKAVILPEILDEGSAVFRYWLSDGRLEQLVPAKEHEPVAKAYPKLLADGRTLFYLEGSYALTGSKLIRYDLTSGTRVPIATVDHTFDVSPDGEQLVIPFLDPASKRVAIRIIDKAGNQIRDLLRLNPDERIVRVVWSPDGKWIYFGKGTDQTVEIDRVSIAGGKPMRTGLLPSGVPDIEIHPDGTKIAYLDRGASELWRVDGIDEALARLRQ